MSATHPDGSRSNSGLPLNVRIVKIKSPALCFCTPSATPVAMLKIIGVLAASILFIQTSAHAGGSSRKKQDQVHGQEPSYSQVNSPSSADSAIISVSERQPSNSRIPLRVPTSLSNSDLRLSEDSVLRTPISSLSYPATPSQISQPGANAGSSSDSYSQSQPGGIFQASSLSQPGSQPQAEQQPGRADQQIIVDVEASPPEESQQIREEQIAEFIQLRQTIYQYLLEYFETWKNLSEQDNSEYHKLIESSNSQADYDHDLLLGIQFYKVAQLNQFLRGYLHFIRSPDWALRQMELRTHRKQLSNHLKPRAEVEQRARSFSWSPYFRSDLDLMLLSGAALVVSIPTFAVGTSCDLPNLTTSSYGLLSFAGLNMVFQYAYAAPKQYLALKARQVYYACSTFKAKRRLERLEKELQAGSDEFIEAPQMDALVPRDLLTPEQIIRLDSDLKKLSTDWILSSIPLYISETGRAKIPR